MKKLKIFLTLLVVVPVAVMFNGCFGSPNYEINEFKAHQLIRYEVNFGAEFCIDALEDYIDNFLYTISGRVPGWLIDDVEDELLLLIDCLSTPHLRFYFDVINPLYGDFAMYIGNYLFSDEGTFDFLSSGHLDVYDLILCDMCVTGCFYCFYFDELLISKFTTFRYINGQFRITVNVDLLFRYYVPTAIIPFFTIGFTFA
jgi:hypothetical protein